MKEMLRHTRSGILSAVSVASACLATLWICQDNGPAFQDRTESDAAEEAESLVVEQEHLAPLTTTTVARASTAEAPIRSKVQPQLGRIADVAWTFSPWNFFEGANAWIPWTFQPLYSSLQEAMADFGITLKHAGMEHACEVRDGVRQALEAKRVPLVIAVGLHMVRSKSKYNFAEADECPFGQTLIELSKTAGVHLILYLTEPRAGLWLQMQSLTKRLQAKEVWTYSIHIVRSFGHLLHGSVPIRHVPPGCASGLDFGVDLQARSREVGRLGFLGLVNAGTKQRRDLLSDFGDLILPRYQIWNGSSLRSFVEQYPLQLNLHRLGVASNVLEMFRISLLLTNGACLFSNADESQHDVDEAVQKMIHFASFSDLRGELQHLLHNNTAVRQCQENGRRLFCEHYRPRSILVRSRAVLAWKEMYGG